VKTIRRVKGVVLLSPLLINASPLRVKSERIKLIEEKFKKRFSTFCLLIDYLVRSRFEGFLINTSVDSIDDLTNKAAMSKLEINELPP